MTEQFIEAGQSLFIKKYPQEEVPERWNNRKIIEHSDIGLLKIIMQNTTNLIESDFTVNLSIWFDPHLSTIEYHLYNKNSKLLLHNETPLPYFSYENILNAIKALLIIFIRDTKKRGFQVVKIKS